MHIIDTRDLLGELQDLVGGDEENHDKETVDELDEADRRNRESSAREVADFKVNAPSSYFAYSVPARFSDVGRTDRMGSRITTWMGDDLARVTWRGDVFSSGFGDRRQNFRALSIDGETVYSGTAYLSAGDYVRMRKVKS